MSSNTDNPPIERFDVEEPEGQVPLKSAFYVERSPIEQECYEKILKPGSLIRIKAPRQMGKSSLMSRILARAEREGYRIASLNFQSADAESLSSLNRFLYWFCVSLSEELNLENRVDEYCKNSVTGIKNNCTKYFQRHLLPSLKSPLALGLDEVDEIFQYPEIATEFFGLLRTWHERGKNEAIWKNLRLAIAHSKEVFIPLNVNRSPFNVGLPVELPEFNRAQVQDLVGRHGLDWSEEQVDRLMAMVGGDPYLVRLALYEIARGRMSLDELLEIAPTEESPYADRLRRHLWKLEKDPALKEAIAAAIAADSPIEIKSTEAFKLRSMGLVKFRGNGVIPLCNLYRFYLRDRLSSPSPVVTPSNPPLDSFENDLEGKLAAILFTDVADSTKIIFNDEKQMLELLKQELQLMREICQRYKGQVLNDTGDGLLMSFESVVNAVLCAREIQQFPNRVLMHRIGIHVGEVFFREGNVKGAGVHLAARLQSLAEPGGICISQTVYDAIKHMKHLPLQVSCLLGPQELKGVPEAVSVYFVNPVQ